MKPSRITFFSALAVILSLSCSPLDVDKPAFDSGRATSERSQYRIADRANGILNPNQESPQAFQDRTEEVVSQAQRLIEKNQEEGAALDQRWYGLKYFAKHQELIFNAAKIMFLGGREDEVRAQLGDRYVSIDPVEESQDSGDIRLFIGKRDEDKYDFIIIGQNGKEVALKTIIRLLYLTKFTDEPTKQKYHDKLASFKNSLQVLMSPISARQEFIAFFNKHGIRNPDAVMIGFRGDIRSLMKEEGISDPESYTDESLRVNWYPHANGKKVLLVSIDKNRIFASRSGALIEAIFTISASTPPSITLLGAGGAIDAREMVGKIVTPVRVMNGDSLASDRNQDRVAHIIRNRAADESAIKTADVTVESVVVETTAWVRKMKDQRIDTVDQELFHIMAAINSSGYGGKVDVFIGTLVTDNVSSNANDTDVTLEHAEETISATGDIRREFFSKVLKALGILKTETKRMPRRSQSLEIRQSSLRADEAMENVCCEVFSGWASAQGEESQRERAVSEAEKSSHKLTSDA
jgi:hypothetical protein